jgi:ABC-type Na+ transport system ATPase subunit NatA
MIELRRLAKRYGQTLAVDDLSFRVQPGKVTGFLGPNGAGKSTSMRMVLGLDRPTAGHALVRTPAAAELSGLLTAPAQTVRRESGPVLTVAGLTTDEVGAVAHTNGRGHHPVSPGRLTTPGDASGPREGTS